MRDLLRAMRNKVRPLSSSWRCHLPCPRVPSDLSPSPAEAPLPRAAGRCAGGAGLCPRGLCAVLHVPLPAAAAAHARGHAALCPRAHLPPLLLPGPEGRRRLSGHRPCPGGSAAPAPPGPLPVSFSRGQVGSEAQVGTGQHPALTCGFLRDPLGNHHCKHSDSGVKAFGLENKDISGGHSAWRRKRRTRCVFPGTGTAKPSTWHQSQRDIHHGWEALSHVFSPVPGDAAP